ncbi:endonuclease/exonuclease/phosphatase family protein [Streptomyces acidiscabies]|uniref:endonuclease/exonuclease/phosphatase family protein n=1 Tax=Streptomyces acidiscabies TaxID=42234 RepID=UPI000967BB1F|nr:endonuclease/exonuclease/phosphatase family protein [Streptomyces acidiscabies]GAV38294.1 hypothetical protein Saa2_01173 [Streptomyces acidiscabies]
MKKYNELVINLGLMNQEHDGGPEPRPGVFPAKWRTVYEEVLPELELDWLASTETTYSQTRADASQEEKEAAERRWQAAQHELGMKGFRGGMGFGRNPVASFARESTFTIGPQYHQYGHRTPPANVVLGLPEVPGARIITAAFHSASCSIPRRRGEAYELSALLDKIKAQHGVEPGLERAACWMFGDTNSYPLFVGDEWVTPIDWTSPEVIDLPHRLHRAEKQPDGTWKSDTFLDEFMHEAGMHDPARYAARYLGQRDALTSTAGFARIGQGGPSRIDRGYMDAWSVQAVLDVRVIDMTGLSDHHLLVVTLSRRKFAEGLRRSFAPLKPWHLAQAA